MKLYGTMIAIHIIKGKITHLRHRKDKNNINGVNIPSDNRKELLVDSRTRHLVYKKLL